MALLTDEQKRTFKRDGYLVLEDAISSRLVDDGRELIWEGIPPDPEDDLTKASDITNAWKEEYVQAEEPFLSINREMYEYAVELVGDALVEPDDPSIQIAIRFPKDLRLSDTHERRATGAHLDGYGPYFRESGEWHGFTVCGAVYFDEVGQRGGGFTVWPGSHWVAADYFEDHPLTAPGQSALLPAIDDEGGWDHGNAFWQQACSGTV